MREPPVPRGGAPRLPRRLAPVEPGWLEDPGQVSQALISDEDLAGRAADGLLIEASHLRRLGLAGTRLANLRIFDSRLERCDGSGAVWERARFRRVELLGCRLLGINLIESRFEDASFRECNGEGAVLIASQFKGARFEKCVFREASFEGADLSGAVFRECDLTRTDFRGTTLRNADFRTSTIDGVVTGIAELQGAIIHPSQAVQFVSLLGLEVREDDEITKT